MLVKARDIVEPLVIASKTEDEVVAMRPLAELDKTWADNDEGAKNFTRMVYNSFKRS